MSGAVQPALAAPVYTNAGQATSYTVATFTPVANRGYLLHLNVGDPDGTPGTVTVAGTTGLAWIPVTREDESSSPWRSGLTFKASKPSGLSNGTVVVSCSGTLNYCVAHLTEFPGADAGTDGANLIVQAVVVDTTNTAASSKAVALAAPPTAATNNIVMVFALSNRMVELRVDPTDTGWNVLDQTELGSGRVTATLAAWKDDLDQGTTIEVRLNTDPTQTDTAKLVVTMVEVKAALVPDPEDPTPAPAWLWQYNSGTNATSYTPGSTLTPVVDQLYLMAVEAAAVSGSFGATTLSFSGSGLTMAKLATANPLTATPQIQGELWWGIGTGTPTNGTFTAGFGAVTCDWAILQLCEVAYTAPAGPIVGYAIDDTNDALAASLVVTYGSTFEAGGYNRPFAVFFSDHDGSLAPATSPSPTWTELHETTRGTGGGVVATYWYDGQDASVGALALTDALVATTARIAGIFVELRGTEGSTTTPIGAGDDTLTFDDNSFVDFELGDTEPIVLATEELAVDISEPPGGGPAPPGVAFGSGATTVLDLVVRVRDAELNIIGEVDDLTGLWLVLRHGDISSWVLEVPGESPMARRLLDPKAGIVVQRKGLTILSGSVAVWERHMDNGARTLRVAGDDDTGILAAVQCPPAPDAPYTAAEYDVRTGPGETLMYGYVNDNGGPAAPVLRQWPNLVMDLDLGRGGAVTAGSTDDDPATAVVEVSEYVRWHSALEVCQRISVRTGLGFSVRQVDIAGVWKLQFSVYEPVDRSGNAVFGEGLGNLVYYSYVVTRPKATWVFVGGPGEDVERVIAERSNDSAVARYGRLEMFVEGSGVPEDDDMALAAAGDAALIELGATTSLELGVTDTPLLAYGAHYQVGDIVAVMVDDVAPDDEGEAVGARIVDVVRQVEISYTGDDGETVTPQVGDATTSPTRLFADVKQLRRQVAALERR